jgi:tetratricopeptide (TPR) repeat protein
LPILHINQNPANGAGRYRIDVTGQIPDRAVMSFSREIEFALTPRQAEQIRWYLEDYLQFAQEPAPTIAKRVEQLMVELGEALFHAIFEGDSAARRLWDSLEPHLSSTRVEIVTGIAEASSIPWEMLRNPETRVNLALSAQAFVRAQREAQTTLAPAVATGKVRILLVICRPQAANDVPFRSVASRLVMGLSAADREAFDLDVLRPPTFERLSKVLRLAKEKGEPYHIVHFDGHGCYADPKTLEGADFAFGSLTLKAEASGPRGFLVFEDPNAKSWSQYVDGFAVGSLLRDAGVPILILNACQSAFTEASATPKEDAAEGAIAEIESYGSLAQAVMNAGAVGVVAMRYSVYAVTAAQFVSELYEALARGRTLGEAASFARKNLADEPGRKIAYDERPLQDWVVPIVWEREPLRLWTQKQDGAPIRITRDGDGASSTLDRDLPTRPDVGFFGRDETLQALDRAFDKHSIVLLHGYAGAGKTTAAAEFARWYASTGGVEGPVLFTRFESLLPLERVLDKIGEVFGPKLEDVGVHWNAETDENRRLKIALAVLSQKPVLWIWDNIEPIAGFPAGTPSEWNAAEQRQLRDFLAAARETKAKFLLTSRRDEQAWLGDLPRRVSAPSMPMRESLQLAGGVAENRGKRLADLPDLTPLLKFTRGNPLTILITVREVMREGIDSAEKLAAFVATLRSGEAQFEDDETEGRTKSLSASLSYGFANAFCEDERKILSLLHFFQGFADVDALRWMGAEWNPGALAEVIGLTRETGIALLDRAAELGLLTALGNGYYRQHPALPWYFRSLFERHFTGERAERARHAFAEAIGELGVCLQNRYAEGNYEALRALMAEEDNLLAALRFSRQHQWWPPVILALVGLHALYRATGRNLAWRRLMEAITPDFVDPATDLALEGREEQWSAITSHRVNLARRDEHDLAKAEHLQRLCLDWDRKRARSALATAPERQGDAERNAIRTLAGSALQLGAIQGDNDNPACVESLTEAFNLAQLIGDTVMQQRCAFSIGLAYTDVSALRNFDEAERWLQKSLELLPAIDTVGQGKTLSQLGKLFVGRFDEGHANEQPQDELLQLLNKAAQYYLDGLTRFPLTAIEDRGVAHNQLGSIYRRAGYIEEALKHYQQSILYKEQSNDIFGAGQTRFNAAHALLQASCFEDARSFAEAALANYREFGDRAAVQIQRTEQLLVAIDAYAKEQEAS